MSAGAPAADVAGEGPLAAVRDGLAIVRYHIVLIAMAACAVFGWLLTGERRFDIALVAGLDWFLINLLNRVTDIAEDQRNGIQGTGRVARHARALTIFATALLVGSFATHLVLPALTPYRVAVQLIGLAYNYEIVPTPRGLSRFKEMYFFKNFGSAVLFVLTGIAYPVAVSGLRGASWWSVGILTAFFVPFELTYEILYDLRDLEGDRAEGVPTYPVVHGMERARQIIDGLLVGSAAALVVGLGLGEIGVREGLMLAAPAIQLGLYRPRYRRGLSAWDCILLTHVGTALLAFFWVGTAAWQAAGLPENVFLR
jgi:4-hydroxybenzoate polyprenyltransferase